MLHLEGTSLVRVVLLDAVRDFNHQHCWRHHLKLGLSGCRGKLKCMCLACEGNVREAQDSSG